MKPINVSKLNEALQLLNEQLVLTDAPATEIVVCGGSALIATGLVPRTTQDVDETSGGGITLSGGEPLFQFDFAYEILRLAKENGLPTAIETCGYEDEVDAD